MPAPSEILELVKRFQANQETYTSGQYNEAQTRLEFIDPFFKALGWDMYNEQGFAEAYKDVIHEDAIKIGGATKAPDYCFRIGGQRKFFLEAKKPGVNLKDDPSSAYQLRRYAWSAKLPLSILGNFRELAVYDGLIKPDQKDPAGAARIIYLTCEQYDDRWEELAGIFGKSAVLKGSFDRFSQAARKKKGTAEVDAAFLMEIESWRDVLARSLALRNSGLLDRELNFAVQATIDRIIFLRICEDRGIEFYGRMMQVLNGENVYKRLFKIFEEADDRYNSGLFHFREERGMASPPDTVSPGLTVDDKPLKDIIAGLYYPASPYEFSVLPAEILGQVYEQFLGKVIRLTPGHRAVVEDKPEVRRAGGVYYTPSSIVNYIVEKTLGSALGEPRPGAGMTPRKAARLKILDPACGSGSFLLQAYQKLLEWHRDFYLAHGPTKHKKEIYPGPGGEWRLSTAERKRVLLNNIFGVDIDPQAVEVTKLSLLLKVLEGESEETIKTQLKFLKERALPDLGGNIRCGNSLIGPEIFNNHQLNLLEEDDIFRINAFDWKTEFSDIFNRENPGFDVVISNPPYVAHQLSERERNYFNEVYAEAISGRTNLYALFICRSSELLRSSGYFGFINPKSFLNDAYFRNLRKVIAANFKIERIVNIRDRRSTFVNVLQAVAILIMQRRQITAKDKVKILEVEKAPDLANGNIQQCEAPWSKFYLGEKFDDVFLLAPSSAIYKIIDKMRKQPAFLPDISGGASTGAIQWDLYKEGFVKKAARGAVRLIWAENIQRYFLGEAKRRGEMQWIRSGEDMRKKPLGPGIYVCTQRVTADEQPRRIIAALLQIPADFEKCYFENHTNNIYFPPSEMREALAVLGLLNSKLFDFYFRRVSSNTQVSAGQLNLLPLRDPADLPEELSKSVKQVLELNRKLALAKVPEEKNTFQRQISNLERKIDRLVYDLYGLTEKEIEEVESG